MQDRVSCAGVVVYKIGYLVYSRSCCIPSVLNHSTFEFQDFSERAPEVNIMFIRRIFER